MRLEEDCEQAEAIIPEYNISKVWGEKERIVGWLSGAIKIRTEVFDEMRDIGVDKRWDVFYDFHSYLRDSFPLVHSHFTVTSHNLSLVYELPGSDPTFKPLMLTAHQDVVPVLPSTIDQWTQPPFSGLYDGVRIWGRGAADTKSSLIAILASLEFFLEDSRGKGEKWIPKRGLVLAFGSDEERGGLVGAPKANEYLVDKYGEGSMAMLVDEGNGLLTAFSKTFAAPGVAEKGHADIRLTIRTPGGHSSVPPKHTGIGLLSLFISELERNPHPISINEKSPLYGFMTCAARYGDVSKEVKKGLKDVKKGKKGALDKLPDVLKKSGLDPSRGLGQGNPLEAMMSTTQAADMISGGVKTNALPEVAAVIINHRISLTSSASELHERTASLLIPLCKQYGLSYINWHNQTLLSGDKGSLTVDSPFGYHTEPVSSSPTDISDGAWRVLSGTSRGIWNTRKDKDDGKGELIMAPFMTTGNTDTRRYRQLTPNIYRFRYLPADAAAGAHTVSEWIDAEALVEFTRWYQALILNMDQVSV
ncbi:hypothetical protein TREMEDRAFT_33687 [Tremella mesenterica DSM 1558]|uniref:uncharacterized protein n=1 Tax=Tremella mesenterica (strain ATCC 24925 / CBS 8224 / DSM 1558 / NBRC 9311 / NRRL Y-6157 / RJB 2259-6 / UBC 559-6) TaxID=578456 RepID=UPI0003F49711|nr:uncharacterized protein TREMEDRAFT_33687 [Tremella mesenterica DSM 1558]EIW67186.1 hypothetical protein TREMEDRAFT_33687 [Tremella mesenterica DSM 1558]